MEILTAVSAETLGAGALVTLTIVSIITGWLLPRKTHEQIVMLLQTALDLERSGHKQVRDALTQLVNEHGATTDHVLKSLPPPSKKGAADDPAK